MVLGFDPVIEGVEITQLMTHNDERGWFREVGRIREAIHQFGQWSHTKMYPGTIKAWHIHSIQTDHWYVPIGTIKAVLYDRRVESKTWKVTQEFILGEDTIPKLLKIPPGVAHGLKVLGGKDAHLFYITSHIYNPSDEGRIPYNDIAIGYDWLKEPEIK